MNRLMYAVTGTGLLGMVSGMFGQDGGLLALGAVCVFAGGLGLLIYPEPKP